MMARGTGETAGDIEQRKDLGSDFLFISHFFPADSEKWPFADGRPGKIDP
jgi:hypothetical protein